MKPRGKELAGVPTTALIPVARSRLTSTARAREAGTPVMPRLPTPAQRAVQITFVLKGHLKNARIAYIRAAILLAKVRDERLWQALHHRDIEEYAAKRLGLQRTALYHYLQIHDWLREFHPSWLAPRPKGFIPELSDASALMWIEARLRDDRLADSTRKALEAVRKKALAGTLTAEEFRVLRASLGRTQPPLRAILLRLRSARRAADRVPQFPAKARAALDDAIRFLEQSLGSAEQLARLTALRSAKVVRIAASRRSLIA